ncbi:MAG: diaminopimelate epimerase [Propioniciclava sp.]|uniref:diaminopimelate epimerase n=1 Tax=Propioniciclava sp. TaxID=2038686 RepID=UPI0039E3195D
MLEFAKGHGTRNDFVLVTDADDARPLSDADVRFLCDRRAGIGGDGVLRAVRARHIPGWGGDPELWFMDYRNADGSLAEMCGNGVRVFARYLAEEGLVDREGVLPLGTRAGLRSAELLADGRVRVWMGRPAIADAATRVSLDGAEWPATPVDVGNPHAVVLLDAGEDLGALDLTRAPVWTPAERFPHGVNVEFVDDLGAHEVRMRVFERGVGETDSCGTGTVAAASATARAHGQTDGTWTVHVPGGQVEVELRGGEAWLTGPAVIVARGSVRLPGEGDS